MSLKLTKEVKAFAEREFNNRVEKEMEKFYKPIKDEEKKIKGYAEKRIAEINDLITELKADYPEFSIKIDTTWEDNEKIFYANVSKKVRPSYERPDKIRFMAELSTGETLDDVSALLEKFFS